MSKYLKNEQSFEAVKKLEQGTASLPLSQKSACGVVSLKTEIRCPSPPMNQPHRKPASSLLTCCICWSPVPAQAAARTLRTCWTTGGRRLPGISVDGQDGGCGAGWEDLRMALGIGRVPQDATRKRWSSEAVVLPMRLGLVGWNYIGVLLLGLDPGCSPSARALDPPPIMCISVTSVILIVDVPARDLVSCCVQIWSFTGVKMRLAWSIMHACTWLNKTTWISK